MESENTGDYLYDLVWSLTKSEKLYFKKFAAIHVIGGQNKYVALFDVISGNIGVKNLNEKVIKFCKQYSVKNYPVLKKYLYLNVLKSLNSYYFDSDSVSTLRNETGYIEILFKKGLYKNCAKYVNKALNKARESENFNLMMDILSWKKNLILKGVYEGNKFENLRDLNKAESDIINKLKITGEMNLLFYRADSIMEGNNPDLKKIDAKTELQNILKDPLLNESNRLPSGKADITRFRILADIYEYLGMENKSFENRKKLLDMIEKRTGSSPVALTDYINSVYDMLPACLGLNKFNELDTYIGKLKSLDKKYHDKIPGDVHMRIILGSIIYKIRVQFIKGEFGTFIKNFSEMEKNTERFKIELTPEDKSYLNYLAAYGYFGARKFNESLVYINKILSQKISDQNVYLKSEILKPAVFFEMGDFENLKFQVKSSYRYLLKSRHKGFEEMVVINLFRKLPGIIDNNGFVELLKDALDKIKTIRKFKFRGVHGEYKTEKFEVQNRFTESAEFDIESWLESKIMQKSFEEAVKARFLSENSA